MEAVSSAHFPHPVNPAFVQLTGKSKNKLLPMTSYWNILSLIHDMMLNSSYAEFISDSPNVCNNYLQDV